MGTTGATHALPPEKRAALRALAVEENRDRVWLRRARIGADQLRAGHHRAALRVLERTVEWTGRFPVGDPRHAAALNNAAWARARAGDVGGAIELADAAVQAWARARTQWLEGMRLGTRARSSLFHLRMERKHRDRYASLVRAEQAQQLLIGELLGQLSRAALSAAADQRAEGTRLHDAALGRAYEDLGPRHPLTEFARGGLPGGDPVAVPGGGAAYGHSLLPWGEIGGLVATRPPAISDEPRVQWALYWTMVLGSKPDPRR